MKIRHLLLGLMICVAGTGAINLSGGFLDDQNTTQLTPFLIFGHVLYEGGAPCNSPNVSITNLNTGAAWCADTVSDSNFYQTLLTLADVSAGDVLRWSTTDDTVFNTTNHTVGQSDLDSGGILGFNLTLVSTAPGIRGYAPESQINDTGDATRRFNITIDQVVDVTWLINGSPFYTSTSVTDASYTYTVGIGVWNISARASNENGTVMQTWTWNVTALSPPNITSFIPPSPVSDTENATQTFGIIIDQVVDVTWLINGTEVSDEADVNESSYTNTSASIGVWNVTAIASNQNGTDLQEWTWYVTPYTPPPSPIFVIYGEVFYEDKTSVDAPCVVVTNLNTSREFVADNRSGSNFYQIITDASEICTGDLLMINASKDGTLTGSVNHTVTSNESRAGAIRVDINRGWADLRVVGIFSPPYIFDNMTNTINATIANNGTTSAGRFNVSLAVDGWAIGSAYIGSLGAGCTADVTFNWTPVRTGDHTLIVTADSDGEIDESDEANNATSVDVFVGVPDFTIVDLTFDTPVNLYDGVNINAVVANYGVRDDMVEVGFYVDDNSTPFNTTEVFVLAGGTSSVATIWNATLAAHHNITAVADPKNSTPEIDESNNSLSRQIFVDASDLTVTDITIAGYVFDPEYPDETEPMFEYPNNVTAAIANIGNLSACALVEFHSRLDISSECIYRELEVYHNTSNDTITQPNASKMRVHFSFVSTGTNSHINISDKNNNTVEKLKVCPADGWSNWVDGDVIRMHSYIGGSNESVLFVVDKYEYIFADATVSLDAHNSTNVSGIWHADPAIIANETQSRYVMLPYYNISVILDPDDAVTELNESNNELNTPAELWYPYDFTITNISFSLERPREGEPVTIDAAIENLGFRGIDTDVAFYVDGNLIGTADVYAEANGTEHVSAIWDALPDINHLTEEHNITVVVDPNNGIEEQDELNNDKTRSINVALANLTITDITTNPAQMIIGDTVDVIATIRNNENAIVNSTVWFCEENGSIDIRRTEQHGGHDTPCSNYSDSISSHHDAIMTRVHFSGEFGERMIVSGANSFINVYGIDGRLLNSYTGEDCSGGWTGWGVGDTIVIQSHVAAGYYEIYFVIDKYQMVFGNTTITIPANEFVNLSMNWTVTQKNPGLCVIASNATNFTDVSVSGTDIAVTDVSVSNDLWDGDMVNINATITNFGRMNASSITVKFYDVLMDANNQTVLITERNITSLGAGDSINITIPWTARLKVGDDVSHNHTIKVEAEPDNEYNEDNSTNNTGYSDTITVKRSRDFSVTNITFYIGNKTLDPMNMSIGGLATINATVEITNLASCSGSVNVSCCLDNTTPIEANRTMSFPANNGTEYVEFEWGVRVHGNHTITVTADPGNETSEFDESNNKFNRSIYIRAPDLTVTTMTFDPESPEVDGMVNITATVENLGNEGVTHANLTIYDCYKEYIVGCDGYYSIKKDEQLMFERDAAAMRLYLELGSGGNAGIYDSQGIQIGFCDAGFSGWTPWVFGDCTVKCLWTKERPSGGWFNLGIRVKKINYLTEHDLIHTKNYSLMPGDTANITVNRCVNTTGTHAIIAIIDPKKLIMESDESNNGLSEVMVVRGADLTVSDMRLTVDGNEVNESNIIEYEKVVNINATISNIGIRPANNFNVSFFVDTIEIANATNLNLTEDESINISASWDTIIGDYTIKVIADPENHISETNESNNTLSKGVLVRGADLSITETNIIYKVIPPEGATINDTGGGVYDTDTVMINATIANEGIVPARNFSVNIFYEYGYLGNFSRDRGIVGNDIDRWVNKSYGGADCIYIHVSNPYNINGRLIIYGGDGTEVARPNESCWIAVIGDTASIKYRDVHGLGVRVDFYAGDITKIENQSLAYGESMNVSVMQCVNTGDHPVRVFIDPENNVHENSESNNIADVMIQVHPSRDFVADLRLFYNGTEIDVDDTILDGDTVLMNTIVGMGINESDPYHEYRKAIAEVEITDEHDWVDISPRCELTPHGYAQVIRYPGADAIKVNFTDLNIPPGGQVWIRDKNWTVQWSHGSTWIYYKGAYNKNSASIDSSWVEGDTVYVYKAGSPWKRITYDIDRYQYRRINHVNMPLNASETKNIIAEWGVSAWNHTMRAIVDPEDKTGEINESNNEACKTLNVDACKDPAVVDLTFNPQKPAMGTDVTISASIMNKGNRTADFTVDLWAEKIEYHPFESPHDDDFPHWVCDDTGCGWRGVGGLEWEIPSTCPDADWMGIHFTKLEMWTMLTGKAHRNLYVKDENGTVRDNFCGSGEEDVWAWVKGDKIKLETTKASFSVWGFSIDNHGYKIVLNRTTLTLAPNETANVTGVLRSVRAGNRSINYTIHANVDMDNVIYETDESNNEMIRTLNIAVPDFAAKVQSTQDGNVRAVFRNRGFGSADVRVFFSRDVDYPIRKSGSWFTRVPKRPVQDDIDWTRIHFEEMEIRAGGYVEVGNERYEESSSDFWSPWVEGDRVRIKYLRTSFEIDRYEFAEEDFIDDFGGGSWVTKEIPWNGYAEPYNLTVWIDPLDEVLEGNEDDNNDTMRMGTDISVDERITVDPRAPIMGDICYIKGVKNIGNLPTEEFNVIIFINATNETAFEHNTTIDETISLAPDEEYSFAWETPVVDPPDDIDYDIRIVADPEDVVKELDEDNNEVLTDDPVTVYSHTNYTGGELYLYDTDWVYGNINYTIGDSAYKGGTWEDYAMNFEDVIPENIRGKDIKLARLYLYWTWGKAYSINESKFVPVPIEVNVKFNNGWISEDRRYTDYPHATDNDVAWGTYTYNIPSDAVKPDNSVIVDRSPFKDKYDSDPWYVAPQHFGIYGVGLLVIYESDDGVLTNYWVTEGGDVIYDGANNLGIGDMATTAVFEGKVEDKDMTNATLWTVTPGGGNDETALYFNKGRWENVWDANIGVDHRCVTDHLITRDNTARLQYISGKSMMSSGAFLFVRYPPDLAITNLTAPASTVVGAHHSINTTIRNDGRSDAHDFNVTFHIDGKQMVRIPHLDLAAGENMTLHLYNWTPMMLMHVYNLTAAVDVLSGEDWTEIETDNNAMTKRVLIEEGGFGNRTGPRGTGGGSNPTGGEYTEPITGRVMQGIKEFLSMGGGGGAGMFSLTEWVMKGAVWLVLMLFVCTGYFMEQRSYGRVRVPGYAGGL